MNAHNYEAWIAENYPTRQTAKTQCDSATTAMQARFPHLKRVRGYAWVGINRRPHWWLTDCDGEIVDPTKHQWEHPIVFYEPVDESSEEPCGKCIECGDLCYRNLGASAYHCHECIS